MSLLSSRPALRWAVPAGVLAVAVAAGGIGQVLSANAAPALPERSAAQLLVDLQNAQVQPFSGTVVQKANLGLPSLPAAGGQGSSNLTSLISGTHTLRVWFASPEKFRLALLGSLGESDVIRNGNDVWTWSSDKNSAVHYTTDAKSKDKAPMVPPVDGMPKSPQEAADQLLKAVDPTTKVSTDGTAKVAGRSAYELVLQPRDTASRVGQVRLAVDSKVHVPLRVQVFAKGSGSPSFEVKFEQVSFATPDEQQFRFTAPKGTKVTEGNAGSKESVEKTLPSELERALPNGKLPDVPKGKPAAPEKEHVVIGKGWTTVVVLPGGELPAAGDPDNPITNILGSLPRVSGSWGSGSLLKSALFSVLFTDDGRVLAGLVSPEQLYKAAADPAAKAPR